MTGCRCGIDDWRGLREALGLSRKEFSWLLAISQSRLHMLEHPERYGHHCPRPAVLRWLWHLLRQGQYRERLRGTRYEAFAERAARVWLPYE